MKKAVIIIGPPGAGKGTQAELVAYKFGLIHFDTGRYIENLFREKRMPWRIHQQFKQGHLINPVWILRMLKGQIKRIAKTAGLVLSGSPRTLFEAFGDKKHKGLIDALVRAYGKKNIIIFELDIPPRTTILRNSKRRICSVCWKPHLLGSSWKNCPFCGGKLIRRVQDKPAIIKNRLKEYEERTKPVLIAFNKAGLKVIRIDGRPKPTIVFDEISRYLQ